MFKLHSLNSDPGVQRNSPLIFLLGGLFVGSRGMSLEHVEASLDIPWALIPKIMCT